MDNIRPWLTANRDIEKEEEEEEEEEITIYPAELEFDRPDLQDARLHEPPTTEYTMTKLDRHTRIMDIVRAEWVNESRRNQVPEALKLSKRKRGFFSLPQPDGRPKFEYDTYHKETVSKLRPDKEDFDYLVQDFEKKRVGHNKAISEKSSLVDLKAGNAQETAVDKQVTPTAKETGDQ